ncbi:hypothetical protein PCE1_003192 [Barthelona sp. PCE]
MDYQDTQLRDVISYCYLQNYASALDIAQNAKETEDLLFYSKWSELKLDGAEKYLEKYESDKDCVYYVADIELEFSLEKLNILLQNQESLQDKIALMYIYTKLGRFNEALELYIATDFPNTIIDVVFYAVQSLLQMRQVAKAYKILDEVEESVRAQFNPIVKLLLAMINLVAANHPHYQGSNSGSLNLHNVHLKEDPSAKVVDSIRDIDALMLRYENTMLLVEICAGLYITIGDAEEAERVCKLVTVGERSPAIWQNLYVALYRSGKFAEAHEIKQYLDERVLELV